MNPEFFLKKVNDLNWKKVGRYPVGPDTVLFPDLAVSYPSMFHL